MVNSTLCPSDNQQAIDQSDFWDENGIHWDAHRIGWLIAGVCAAITVLLTTINVAFHCRNYTNRGEQRQIIRILYMPAVYAIISFFSYRFFRSYTYYELIEVVYEASIISSVTLSAFLLLLIEYVAATAAEHDVDNAMTRKDKHALPIPFCCWRYRPTKAYFMYTVKWSVMQYIILRPILSIAGIICQHYGVLCESGPWSLKTANAYISVIDFFTITIALYGLLIFYGLTKDELVGRKPLSKFLAIKLIVMFTFYQSLVFSALEGRVIHGTQYWTETNVADGLNALAICIEMVVFSAFMLYAYTWKEYVIPGRPKTGVWRPLWDSINYSDFAREIWGSIKFFGDYWRGKPGTHGPRVQLTNPDGSTYAKMDFGEAFGVSPRPYARSVTSMSAQTSQTNIRSSPRAPGPARAQHQVGRAPIRETGDDLDEERVRLAPYDYHEMEDVSGGAKTY
ncbi:organic solute transporter Ostalpha-domain-containing protein [Epithele typhae]|uniref:organic solute transporter Ostalpha-domain-containing protein n=1 Tax=Epithele typhae TaxID=378194 RepID=UPI002007955B|nr:organic solute transporter Ostalpha-domain-containing protein [Epithele typhae]KAH9940132.1 organic solute transporter Ostalpha-domain-containing protein [Epithele typhae]